MHERNGQRGGWNIQSRGNDVGTLKYHDESLMMLSLLKERDYTLKLRETGPRLEQAQQGGLKATVAAATSCGGK